MKKLLFAAMILIGTFLFAACDNKTEASDAEVTTDTTTVMETEQAPVVIDSMATDTAATTGAVAQ